MFYQILTIGTLSWLRKHCRVLGQAVVSFCVKMHANIMKVCVGIAWTYVFGLVVGDTSNKTLLYIGLVDPAIVTCLAYASPGHVLWCTPIPRLVHICSFESRWHGQRYQYWIGGVDLQKIPVEVVHRARCQVQLQSCLLNRQR